LPKPVSKKPYSKIVKDLMVNAEELSETIMAEAAKKTFQTIMAKDPDQIIVINGKEVAKIAVTIDGTWQRRGYSSKYGVVFVISADTGLVLDAVVKSLYCHECTVNSSLLGDKTPEFNKWYSNHKMNCSINHSGSSGKMETDGAVTIATLSNGGGGLSPRR